MSIPLALLFGKYDVLLDNNGVPVANGSILFVAAGTSTPQAVYADPLGVTSLGSTVTLDASGRPSGGSAPTSVFLQPNGYGLTLKDANGSTIVQMDSFENVGAVYLSSLGLQQTAGAKSQTSYTATNDDNLITMNGGTLTLQAAAVRAGLPLVVMSIGSGSVSIVPTGTETINSVSGTYTLGAASSPDFPTLTLYTDGISNYWAVKGA